MQIKKALSFAAIAIMLASCSTNEDFLQQENLEGTPMTFNVGVNDMVTRAGYNNSETPSYFFINIDQEGTNYDYNNVLMHKQSDGSYAPVDVSLVWGPSKNNVNIQAYYLGNRNLDKNYIEASFSNKLKDEDYLGASSAVSGDISISGSSVNIRFRHLLCKMDVTFEWGEEFKDISNKTYSATVRGVGLYGFIDFNTGTITVGSEYNEISPYGEAMSEYTTTNTKEFIFFPGHNNPRIEINATINNNEYRNFEVALPVPAGGFKQGNLYKMNVCIGGNSAKVNNLSVSAWSDIDNNGDFVIE